jgi:hypothetical protein
MKTKILSVSVPLATPLPKGESGVEVPVWDVSDKAGDAQQRIQHIIRHLQL